MKLKRFLTIVVVIFLIGGCQSVDQAAVNALNKALEVIVPHHVEYLHADSKLTELEKEAMVKSAGEVLDLSRKLKK